MTKRVEKPEGHKPTQVWLSYRSKGSSDVRRILVESVTATRWMHKLHAGQRCDYIGIEGTYSPEKDLTIEYKGQRIPKRNPAILEMHVRQALHVDTSLDASYLSARTTRRNRRISNEMSFHVGSLSNDVLIFCPVTGIFGKLEMPELPITLSHEHPLSKPGNALALIRALKKQKEQTIERQVIAGCVMSLLQGKGLLRTEEDSSAAERNAVLQSAGQKALWYLCWLLEYHWDNPQVWKRMPAFTLAYKAHKDFPGSVLEAVQNYTKILQEILNPLSLTPDEQARIFSAQRRKAQQLAAGKFKIKIHTAAAVEERNIKEHKPEIRNLFETLKPHLPLVIRVKTEKLIRSLALFPDVAKREAASSIRVAFIGKPQADLAKELANLLEKSSSQELLSDIGSFSQEISPRPMKSISEILAAKKEKGNG